jgi:hypothetical protein
VATKPAITEAFTRAKAELSRWSAESYHPSNVVKRTLEDQLSALRIEISQLKAERDGWLERWVQVEVNARRYGIDPDLLFETIPKPQRR